MYLQLLVVELLLQVVSKQVIIGDPVEIIGMGAEKLTSTITGVEMFRKILDRGEAGDNVGLLLRGVDKDYKEEWLLLARFSKTTRTLKLRFIS
jgi:translation elongation factor EF-Tu-like GTPase